MENNSPHHHNHHHHDPENHTITVTTTTTTTDRLASLNRKIATPPTILTNSAGRATCSIFKVPKTFKDINRNLYQPHIISIGPFFHGQPHLQMMQEHKYQYLGQLLSRLSKTTNMISLDRLLEAVRPLEEAARECYSEAVMMTAEEHVEMLVVDGCFVVELFRKVGRRVGFEPDDPIRSMAWIFPSLLRDLHRLENQVPFFVLQRLFDLTEVVEEAEEGGGCGGGGRPTLASLCLEFFNYTLQRPHEVISKYKDLQPKHLLDLLRSSFINTDLDPKDDSAKRNSTPSHVILSVSKLRQAGIHLRPGKSETFLAVKFKNGVTEMPTITLDDFMSSLFANCVAYEQCHKNCTTYFTTYVTLVDCLVNTARDAEYLCDQNIIENYFGTEAEIATFINNLGKDVAFDIDQCYLAQLFDDVNTYYKNSWHVYWASFKYTYFSTPWSFISAVAAFVLLVLTVLQTLYTIIQFYK